MCCILYIHFEASFLNAILNGSEVHCLVHIPTAFVIRHNLHDDMTINVGMQLSRIIPNG